MFLNVFLHLCLGTMSGGGNKVSRGGMCSKISEDVDGLSGKELEALEKKLSAHSDELTAIRTKLQQLERAVEQWERECQQLQVTSLCLCSQVE